MFIGAGEPMNSATNTFAGTVIKLERAADLLDAAVAQHDDAGSAMAENRRSSSVRVVVVVSR